MLRPPDPKENEHEQVHQEDQAETVDRRRTDQAAAGAMMDPVVLLLGIGCLVALVYARGLHRVLLAVVMACEWAATNIIWTFGNMRAFTLQDALVLALCLFLFWNRWSGWRRTFLALAGLQLLFDIANELGGYEAYTLWAVLMNALAVAQLVLLAGPGVAQHVRSYLPRHDRHLRHPL